MGLYPEVCERTEAWVLSGKDTTIGARPLAGVVRKNMAKKYLS